MASDRPPTGRPATRWSKRRAGRGRAGAEGGASVHQGYVLTVMNGLTPGKEFFFEHSATVGRVDTNSIVLVEPGISRQHARITDDKGVVLLEDLGSANGTRLNGETVKEPEVLRDGDYLTLGQTTLRFSELRAAPGEITRQTALTESEARAADQPSQTYSHKAPSGHGLSRRRKLIIGLLVVGLAVAAAVLVLQRRGGITVFDQSQVPLIYSEDDEFFNAVFGYGNYDKTHLSQVMVDFEYLGGRATLQYGASGIDKLGELEILLNGNYIGKAPVTMKLWQYGIKLLLPRDQLKRNQSNRIVFRNTLNPRAKESWQICYIQIVQEAIPPPDPRQARLQFELAKKAWEDREIEPGNMSTALIGFKRARDLLENAKDRTELYQEALDYIDRVDAALTRKFADGLFSARRAEKVDSDPQKARTLLLRTLPYFRKDDFRYRELQRYLDSLVGQ